MARGHRTDMKQLSLPEKALAYWKMSSCWNNRPGAPAYTIQDVIDISNGMLRQTDPNRRVAKKVSLLLVEVINKPTRSRKRAGAIEAPPNNCSVIYPK